MKTKKKNALALVLEKLKKKNQLTPSTHKNAKWKGRKSKSWLWV
jgi:hypothetical protein